MSQMDINDVKALIKSLVVSSTVEYSVPRLLDDFKKETGITMPIFNFTNPKAFLRSLTDTIEFVGSSPYEKIRAVESNKSKHISSLVQRQRNRTRCRNVNLPGDYMCNKKFERETSKLTRKMDRNRTVTKLHVNVKNGEISSLHDFNKNYENNNFGGSEFNEDKIQHIIKHAPNLKNSSSFKSNEINDIFEFDSQTSSSNSSSSVNDGIKRKLKKLMKEQTQGIWCCDLPDLYKDSYKFPLEFKELGYRSLIDMVIELTDIFRCVRPGNGDWLLFDASKPPSQEELYMQAISQCEIPENVEKNLLLLLESHCEKDSKPGIYLDDLLVFYYRKFGRRLNFDELGFPNVKSLLSKLDGQILRLVKDGHRFLIKPVFEQRAVNQEIAVFPITPEDDVFTELFPDDVVKQGEKLPSLKIKKYFTVGEKVKVNIVHILSPQEFYIQLKEFENDFITLKRDMQIFYKENINKYKMPNATIQPNQICVGLYSNGCGFDEWLRSVIIKVMDKDKVLLKFVDYGKEDLLEMDKLRFLHRDFFDFPSQSFAAKLSNIEPKCKNFWSLEVSKKFLSLVMVPVAEFCVKSIDFENEVISGMIVSICGKERVNVGDALIESGMAMNKTAEKKQCIDPRTKNNNLDSGETDCFAEEFLKESTIEDNSDVAENEISSTTNIGENFREEETSLFDFTDLGVQGEITSKCMDTIEELSTSSNCALKNYFSLNADEGQSVPFLRQEMYSYAAAFWLMSTNDFVRMIARSNLDNGMLLALKLAKKMSETTEFAFMLGKQLYQVQKKD